jgi:hypothetical protein
LELLPGVLPLVLGHLELLKPLLGLPLVDLFLFRGPLQEQGVNQASTSSSRPHLPTSKWGEGQNLRRSKDKKVKK